MNAAAVDIDSIVIGAGVVGLAVARALAQAGREVFVLEAEARAGEGISARNSGVIHAGLYYALGSWKARLCVRGRRLLYDYCARRGIPHRKLGKLVVANDWLEAESLRVVMERAQANGVDGMLTICCQIATEFNSLLETVKPLNNVWCSIGTHPHDASLPEEKAITLEKLVALANSDDKIIGIGESGLDFYYNHSTPEDQEESFRKHIRACIATDLPLIVHARDADEDIMRVIRDENTKAGKKVRGVMHCFSSGAGLAENALAEGFYISFSGIVTFKKSTDLQAIAKTVPLDRILVETDAPFLAPEPYRGKTNEPSYVKYTGEYVAGLLNLDQETLARHSKDNFFNLFTRAKKTWAN